ncbi:heavy-metal-associated domain-containing protein [Acidobacteria bacterium AH-259-G07]|nr:heavy-metal-associated domain-containing protein [Acidobacteria bacterium AH-259-G07]
MKHLSVFLIPILTCLLVFSFALPRDPGKVVLTIEGKGEIKGMVCAGCKRTVENALKKVEGVHQVAVDLKEQEARVEFDPERVKEKDLIKAVEETKIFTAKVKKRIKQKGS